MSTYIRRIKESVTNRINAWIGKSIIAEVIPGIWAPVEKPKIDRRAYMQLYEENPLAKSAINANISDAIGAGFFTDVKEDEYAKSLIDEFCRKVNMDKLLILATRDMLITGDGVLERIYDREIQSIVKWNGKQQSDVWTPENGAKLVSLKWLPSFTLEVKRTPKGKCLYWRQKADSKYIYFHPDKIVNFQWNPTGLSSYGTSELRAVFDLLKDLGEIQKNFVAVVKRYAKPPIIWKGKGLTEEQLKAHKEVVEKAGPDEDIYINTDLLDAEMLAIDPRGAFENYYRQLIDTAIVGLETPTLPMFSKAAKASARAMMRFYQMKLSRIRRVLRRTVEHEIFRILVNQDPRAREIPKLRFNFPILPEQLDPLFIVELAKLGIFTPDQAKQVLKKLGVAFP